LREATIILEEYAIQAFNLNSQEYVLDEEARRIFSAYEHEKQQGVHASACETQSALHGKSASKVMRITGLVHILRAIHSKKHDLISVNSETLLRAIALVDDLDHWALSQYAKRDAAWTSKITNEMRRLHNLAFLQKGPVTWTILKDKLSSKETKVINRVKADELFRLLEAMGYGRIDSGPRGGLRYEALMELPPEYRIGDVNGEVDPPFNHCDCNGSGVMGDGGALFMPE
jgi:hypothetical protein